jgi:hypothetical protein
LDYIAHHIDFMEKFKQEVLMQFLYGETSKEVSIAIEEALLLDWELQEEIKMLKRTVKQLSSLNLKSPRTSSVNAILNYAKSTDVVTSV